MEELLQIGLGLFGGLALFLYGMNLMSSNLQEAAGERMRAILAALTKNEHGVYLALSPDIVQQIVQQVGELRKKFEELSQTPILLTSQIIRVYLSRMLATFYPDIYVLSFNEITSNVQIQAIGNITLQPQEKRA